ncbi:MAG: cyanophycinase [bacterium]|nr:cyanophycinase [bacterium]
MKPYTRTLSRRTCLALGMAVGVFASAATAQPQAQPTRGWIAAEGGGIGSCEGWTEELFGWMVERASANAPGRKVRAVIIGAIPLDEPDERLAVFTSLGAEAVGIVVDESNANSDETSKVLSAADIIFIRGGDQSRYVNWWKGTATETAIHSVFDRGGVIAGTSAGCAILGEVAFDAKVGSLSSEEAITDAQHSNITLSRDFLGLVPNVIFDTHFAERSRLARAVVLLAHASRRPTGEQEQSTRSPTAPLLQMLGVDPCTAVIVSPTGDRSVKGRGQVTRLSWTPQSIELLPTGKAPTIGPVAMAIYSDGQTIGPETELKNKSAGHTSGVSVLQTSWNWKGADELATFLRSGATKRNHGVIFLNSGTATENTSAIELASDDPAKGAAMLLDFRGCSVSEEPFQATGVTVWLVPTPTNFAFGPLAPGK